MAKPTTAVTQRYHSKTYERYTLNFRKKEDADIISRIEQLKREGYGTTEAFRKLLKTP